jgi:hypothetical protein
MPDEDSLSTNARRTPWNKGKLIGAKPPLRPSGWRDGSGPCRNRIGTSEIDPFRSSILGPWPPL